MANTLTSYTSYSWSDFGHKSTIDEYAEYNKKRQERYDQENLEFKSMERTLLTCLVVLILCLFI